MLCLQVLVYGEHLDLGPFMAAGAMDTQPATYTLSGVVVHLDQVGVGVWICMCVDCVDGRVGLCFCWC